MRACPVYILVALAVIGDVCATCGTGSIKTAGTATQRFRPDTVVLHLSIEVASDSFAQAKSLGDSLRDGLNALHTGLPSSVDVSVAYDLGVLKQKRIAWTKGRKLEYEFRVTASSIEADSVQDVLTKMIDAALDLNSKLIVEDVDASLSPDVAARESTRLLRDAVADARGKAGVIANATALRITRVLSVEAVPVRTPVTGTFGQNLALIEIRRSFSVDAGIPEIWLTSSVLAEFCVEPD